VLCLQLLGDGSATEVKQTLPRLLTVETKFRGANADSTYGWYYIAQALFHAGGDYWAEWNMRLRDQLVKSQDDDGSWNSPGSTARQDNMTTKKVRGEDAKVYHTAMACLILETYYRFVPVNVQMLAQTEVTSQKSAPLLAASASRNMRTLPLKKGLYGVPFGASLKDIEKWCEEKEVQVTGPNANDIQAQLQEQARLLKVIKNDERWNEFFLSALEKEVKKQMGVPNPSDLMAAIQAARTQELLSLLKTPSVISKGIEYHLQPVVPELRYKSEDARREPIEKVCEDDAITKTQYVLAVNASAEMKKDGFARLYIFFWKDGANYFCYAVLGKCPDRESRAKVVAALDEKYGPASGVDNGSWDSGFKVRASALFKHSVVVGMDAAVFPRALAWAENLYTSGMFGFAYYDAEIASRILTRQKEVLLKAAADDKAATKKQESDFKKRAKDNF